MKNAMPNAPNLGTFWKAKKGKGYHRLFGPHLSIFWHLPCPQIHISPIASLFLFFPSVPYRPLRVRVRVRVSHGPFSNTMSTLANIPQTKCPGSKKFATPSMTLYSCAQFPQTSFPSLIPVSRRMRCRSFAVWLGISSTSATASVASSGWGCAPPSTRSSRVGAVSGREGSPSYSFQKLANPVERQHASFL